MILSPICGTSRFTRLAKLLHRETLCSMVCCEDKDEEEDEEEEEDTPFTGRGKKANALRATPTCLRTLENIIMADLW